jgi:hypothetical protein
VGSFGVGHVARKLFPTSPLLGSFGAAGPGLGSFFDGADTEVALFRAARVAQSLCFAPGRPPMASTRSAQHSQIPVGSFGAGPRPKWL